MQKIMLVRALCIAKVGSFCISTQTFYKVMKIILKKMSFIMRNLNFDARNV